MKLRYPITILSVAAAPLFAQQRADRGAFLLIHGVDTVQVERFARDASTLAGEVAGGGLRVRYTAHLRLDGSVERIEFIAEGAGFEAGDLRFSSAGIEGQRRSDGAVQTVSLPTVRPVRPILTASAALLEEVIRSVDLTPGVPARVPVFRLLARSVGTDTIVFRRIGPDSVVAEATEGDLRLAVARDGNITGGTGFTPGERLVRVSLPLDSVSAPSVRPRPRPTRITSPELHGDGTVTLRVRAARARLLTVRFSGDAVPRRLTRDSSDVWSITLGPFVPDVYYYSLTIDGTNIPDPLNPSLGIDGRWSLVEIPGAEPAPWSARDVPHGTVSTVWYNSKSLGGALRSATVYTPPGYEQSGKPLPVLYLLHGANGTETDWMIDGRANLMLDNLIADGRARPMILVAPFGYPEPTTKLGLNVTRGGRFPAFVQAFTRDLLEDVMPLIERRYRTSRTPEQRAIAGLSMGGGEALEIGLSHLERFRSIGGFGSSVPFYFQDSVQQRLLSTTLADSASVNKKIRLLWFACGHDDGFFANNERLSGVLKARGIRHTFVATPGVHSMETFRRQLADFLTLLFPVQRAGSVAEGRHLTKR